MTTGYSMPWNLATRLQICYDSIVYELNWVTKVEVHHPLETCYDSTVDDLQLSYEGGSAPSIRKPVVSYDSTVDELQLSHQGGWKCTSH